MLWLLAPLRAPAAACPRGAWVPREWGLVVHVSPAAVAALAPGTTPCLRWQPHCHGSCAPVLGQRRARSVVSTSPSEQDGSGAGQSPCGAAGGRVQPLCFGEQIKAGRELRPGCRCEHPALTCRRSLTALTGRVTLQPSCPLPWLGTTSPLCYHARRPGQTSELIACTVCASCEGFFPWCVSTFPLQIRGCLGEFILVSFCIPKRRFVLLLPLQTPGYKNICC